MKNNLKMLTESKQELMDELRVIFRDGYPELPIEERIRKLRDLAQYMDRAKAAMARAKNEDQ